MIICGLDISSQRIDCATLREDGPPLVAHVSLGRKSAKLNDRLRAIPDAVNRLTRVGEGLLDYTGGHYERPDWIAIEQVYRHPALHRTIGAIIASCPPACKVKVVTPWEWRKAIECTRDTKEQGHANVTTILRNWHKNLTDEDGYDVQSTGYDEHELDAIGIALGARRMIEGQA